MRIYRKKKKYLIQVGYLRLFDLTNFFIKGNGDVSQNKRKNEFEIKPCEDDNGVDGRLFKVV